MRKRIFISYSSNDLHIAERVCALLEAEGIECWIAPRDVLPGTIYAEEIIKAIEITDALVLICSRYTGDSVHVRSEVEHAFSNKKVIFPVRIEDVELGRALDYFLGSSHWLVAWDVPLEVCVARLAESIRKVIGSEGHTPTADAADLPEVPEIESRSVHPNNLPAQTTPLIGREKEVAAVVQLVERSDVRLVTLTGPGGTGKTRLSLHVASELIEEFEDGVFFVSLAPISDPSMVGSTIAQILGIHEMGNQSIVEILKKYLRNKQLLLVLDNFEQLVTGGPILTELLAAAPELMVLVTSREVLHLSGEFDYPVPPLALPEIDAGSANTDDVVSELTQYGATRLFIARAEAMKPGFTVTSKNAPAIAEICFRLDGLPLAIELAVARLQSLTPQDMLRRLERKLPILGKGARDQPARQRTLKETIGWSFELLDDSEKLLFGRIGVFAGGFDLDAAEMVCTLPDEKQGHDKPLEVIETLESLVTKSLVKQKEAHGSVRFDMLETIREYALRQLDESGVTDVVKRRHADYYLDLAMKAAPALHGPNQVEWFDLLKAELPNIRAAFGWCKDAGDVESAINTVFKLWWFWNVLGMLAEAQKWTAELLEGATDMSDASLARAKVVGSVADAIGGRWESGVELGEEAERIARKVGDRTALSMGLLAIGSSTLFNGDFARAKETSIESLLVARQIKDDILEATGLRVLGLAENGLGNKDRAMLVLEESLAIYRRIGDKLGIAYLLRNMGIVPLQLGDFERAATLCTESLAISHGLKDKWSMAWAMQELATAAALGEKDMVKAARLFGAVEVLREQTASVTPASEQSLYDQGTDAARSGLGEKAFLDEWQGLPLTRISN